MFTAYKFIGLISLFLFLSASFKSGAQDYEPWRMAVESQFPEEDVLIYSHDVHVQFKREKHKEEPVSRINTAVIFRNLTAEPQKEMLEIVLDGKSSLESVRIGRRRIRPAQIKESPYSNGSLLHSDIRIAEIPVEIKGNYRERKVTYGVRVEDVRYLSPIYLPKSRAVYRSSTSISIPEWLNMGVKTYNMDNAEKFEINEYADSRNDRSLKIEAFSFEPLTNVENIPGPSYIYPHILFLPHAYLSRSERWRPLFSNLSDLYEWYRKLVQEVDNGKFKIDNEVLIDILAQDIDPQESVRKITDWVRTRIRYLSFEAGTAGYVPQSADIIYRNGYGDCKGMANLLKTILVDSGIDARLAWLGTNHLVYDYSEPTLMADNHMICVAFLEEDTLFLDATEQWAFGETYTKSIAGRQVLIEDNDDFLIRRIPDLRKENNSVNVDMNIDLLPSGETTVSGQVGLTGEPRVDFLDNSRFGSDIPEALSEVAGFRNRDVNTKNSFDPHSGPVEPVLELELDFSSLDLAQLMGEEIYLNLSKVAPLPYKVIDARRKYNYYFDQAPSFETVIEISLPQNFSPRSIPDDIHFESDFLQLEYRTVRSKTSLSVRYSAILNSDHITPDRFDEWNSMIGQLQQLLKSSIILQRE